jgi:hypothetical protein
MSKVLELEYEACENIKEKVGDLAVSNGKYNYGMKKRINNRLCQI